MQQTIWLVPVVAYAPVPALDLGSVPGIPPYQANAPSGIICSMNEALQMQIKSLAAGDSVRPTDELCRALKELDIGYVVATDGIVLQESIELLEHQSLQALLSSEAASGITGVDLVWSIDSTNTYLMNMAGKPEFHRRVCTAEQQLAGRGRRGNHWVSPFGKNIYLSLGWEVSGSMSSLSGLSLVVGMLAVEALKQAGVRECGLKWPNDILTPSGKLAGILVEIGSARNRGIPVVIGIGINLALSHKDAAAIDQAYAVASDQALISRNALIASLLNLLVPGLQKFCAEGFEAFADLWPEYDVYSGQEVLIKSASQVEKGINRGVDSDGNLLLECDGKLKSWNAGEVSLRPAEGVNAR